ncbi:hypothetical protein HanIR_Chr05g0236341 [Helianthus annuus]|nr:hypothetical protein HanIR_Chr05g0236341 [Helianthus annuus]
MPDLAYNLSLVNKIIISFCVGASHLFHSNNSSIREGSFVNNPKPTLTNQILL